MSQVTQGKNKWNWDISIRERTYHKLAEKLFFRILNHDIPIGSKLPANSLFIWAANTSQATLRKALYMLVELKIVTRTCRVYFVTDDINVVYATQEKYIGQITRAYLTALSKVSYTAEIQMKASEA